MKVISMSEDRHIIVKPGDSLSILKTDTNSNEVGAMQVILSGMGIQIDPNKHSVVLNDRLLYASKNLELCRHILKKILWWVTSADGMCPSEGSIISIPELVREYNKPGKERDLEIEQLDEQLREDEPNEIT